ncbi:sigma-70 family RNA polymerase sigma factor [bacterium]|nr:sigma-70 family RNA polymerase sigma factor [bacterium]
MAGHDKREPGEREMTSGELVLDSRDMLDEDFELIRRVQSGDPDSFEPLVEKYQSFVFGIIRSVIHETSDDEDLAQEAFIQAFRGMSKFRFNAKFKTWLYRVTVNVCLNHLRNLKRTKLQDDEIDFKAIADKSPTPDRTHEKSEMANVLGRIIKTLPVKYGSILHLHYYEDMPYEEISEMTGMPLGTVKSHLHRAKEKVRHAFSDAGLMTGGK